MYSVREPISGFKFFPVLLKYTLLPRVLALPQYISLPRVPALWYTPLLCVPAVLWYTPLLCVPAVLWYTPLLCVPLNYGKDLYSVYRWTMVQISTLCTVELWYRSRHDVLPLVSILPDKLFIRAPEENSYIQLFIAHRTWRTRNLNLLRSRTCTWFF